MNADKMPIRYRVLLIGVYLRFIGGELSAVCYSDQKQ